MFDPTEFMSIEDTAEFADYEKYEAEMAELAALSEKPSEKPAVLIPVDDSDIPF